MTQQFFILYLLIIIFYFIYIYIKIVIDFDKDDTSKEKIDIIKLFSDANTLLKKFLKHSQNKEIENIFKITGKNWCLHLSVYLKYIYNHIFGKWTLKYDGKFLSLHLKSRKDQLSSKFSQCIKKKSHECHRKRFKKN